MMDGGMMDGLGGMMPSMGLVWLLAQKNRAKNNC